MGEPSRISLAMIVKDEEQNLARCLESAAGAVDEIVVVDTGSCDQTVAIAESYGARVIHHPWTGDFAAARNVSVEAAQGEWILWLDADEELSREAGGALRDLVRNAPPEVQGYDFLIANWVGKEPGGHLMTAAHPRLFRNLPQHRFSGRIHEWPGVGATRYTGLRIYHYGYLSPHNQRGRKSSRNMQILQEELAQNPDNFVAWGYLGNEFLRLGRHRQAARCLWRSWQLVKTNFFAERLAYTLLQRRRFGQANALLADALQRWPAYTDLHFHQGCALLGLGDYGGARAAFRRCLEQGPPPPDFPSLEGRSTFLAWYRLGSAEAGLHNWEAAVRACWQALTLRPDFGLAVELLIQALVALLGPAGSLRVVREQMGLTPPSIRLVARTYAAWGCWSEAMAMLEQGDGPEPPLPQDRLLRAECSLKHGQAADAAAELEAILGQDAGQDAGLATGEWQQAASARWLAAVLQDQPAAAAAWLDRLEAQPDSRPFAALLRRFCEGRPAEAADQEALINLTEKFLAVSRPDLADRAICLLDRSGDPVGALGAAGRLLTRYGWHQKAEPYLEEALAGWGRRKQALPAIGGGRCDLLADLAEGRLAAGRCAGAALLCREILEREPQRLVVYLTLAEALLLEAARLLPERKQRPCRDLAEEMRRERHRPEPVYDRPGRGAECGPGTP